MTTIKDLKKGDKFRFNNIAYVVRRKWIDDDRPLIAWTDPHFAERVDFDWEGLEIEKL